MSKTIPRKQSAATEPRQIKPSARPARAAQRAVLVLAVLLTFGQALGYDFVNLDDFQVLVVNPLMNPPTMHSLKVWWTEPNFQLYDPVTSTVRGGVAILAHISPDPATGFTINPWVCHGVNIFLHLGVTLLVYQLLLYLKLPPWPACAGAALFAVHPVQVEPVVWITSIKDLLYGTFGVLAVWRFLISLGTSPAAESNDQRASLREYLLATACFVLAMLSKPMGVTLPVMALPLVWLQWRFVPRKAWYGIGIWILLAIPLAIITHYVQPAPYTVALPFLKRGLVAGDAVAFYLIKIAWPRTLVLHYGRNPAYITKAGFIWWTWSLPAVLLTVLWLNRRRCAPLLAGFCIFVAGLIPVLGFVPFSFQYYSTVADRYLYLPMLGIALMGGWAVGRLPRRYALLSAVPLLVLAGRSALQVRYWQDSLKLFQHVLDYDPSSAVACNQYAAELLRRNEFELAIKYAQRSIELDPSRCEPYDTLARSFTHLSLTSEAMETYRIGFGHDTRTAALLNDFTIEMLKSGQPKLALSFARLTVELVPGKAPPYTNVGAALAQMNDLQGARKALEKAVLLAPDYYNAQADLAAVLFQLGDRAGAISHYRQAESIDPDDPRAPEALKQLGVPDLLPSVQ